MSKDQVIILARELFKIRISSSNEGQEADDEVHKMKINTIGSYNSEVIKKWYMEAIQTAEIIIGLEQEYLGSNS